MSKYHNRRVTIDGVTLDSQAEGRRYQQLGVLANAGAIQDLIVHPRYELLPARTIDGRRERALYYEGDFSYVEGGRRVCEDVKGVETAAFRLKRRLFLDRYPDIELRVIPAKEV